MKRDRLILILLFFIAMFSCRKEKEPIERIDITNPSYSINCINCIQYGQNGTVYSYTSVKTSFNYSSKKARIANGSYLLVKWKFTNGSSDEYIIGYNDLTITGNTISFDSNWAWGSTSNLNLQMFLYSGQGSKSDVLIIDIPKPVGAN